jgi:DNA-binding MarR family transcriptional regulator
VSDSTTRQWRDGLLGGIVRLNLAVTQVLDEITGDAGVTLPDYLVLGVIRAAPDGRSAPTTICDVLGRTTGGMSLTLDRLEAAGLVRRSRHEGDGRRVVVELTAKGHTLATRVNEQLHEWESSLDLAHDVDQVLEIIDGLTGAVRRQASLLSAG